MQVILPKKNTKIFIVSVDDIPLFYANKESVAIDMARAYSKHYMPETHDVEMEFEEMETSAGYEIRCMRRNRNLLLSYFSVDKIIKVVPLHEGELLEVSVEETTEN